MIVRSMRAIAAAILVAAVGVTMVHAADSLAAARDLYASAAYDDALTMLNKLRAAGQGGVDANAIEQYRAYCLLALGRGAEAEDAIAAIVAAAPSYHPSDSDVSPRIRSAFSDVRRRMLPAIIQRKYADAKDAFDRKDFARAADGFAQVLTSLGDPDVAVAAGQPPLSDLRVLANGFHDLAVTAATPPPAPPPPPPVVAPPVAPAKPVMNRIYDGSEGNVVPPVTIRQQLPAFPGRIIGPMHGALDVVIGKDGTVESAAMRVSVNSFYDTLAIAATKTWKYHPAAIDGVPVRFRKIIQISLTPGD